LQSVSIGTVWRPDDLTHKAIERAKGD